MKPGTRCECQDRTHQYDDMRPYARHNVGTCPHRAVRMVTVPDESAEDEAIKRYNRAMAAWTRKGMRGTKAAVDAANAAVHAARNRQVPMCEPCARFAERAR